MRTLLLLLVLLVLVCGAAVAYVAWSRQETPITYRTAEVNTGTIVSTVSATGNIEPLVKVLVGTQVSGTVTRWFADFNQAVQQGFTLAELDQDRFRATLAQRSAALAVARARAEEAAARLARAEHELSRVSGAFAQMAASEFELQTAQTDQQAALAALHAAQAQILASEADERLASIELEKTIIRSPIDGIVIARNVDAGQTVAASLQAPVLFTIANDLAKMRVNAAVSETDIGRIREGMEAEFRVDAYPERRFRGVVSQVRYAETIIDNVVTYTTLIDVDNPDLALRPGMTATILFQIERADQALLVPNAALRFDPQAAAAAVDFMRPGRARPARPRVFRLEPDGRLTEVAIQPGITDGASTQVLGGELRPGDAVVIEQVGGATIRTTGPFGVQQQRPMRGM